MEIRGWKNQLINQEEKIINQEEKIINQEEKIKQFESRLLRLDLNEKLNDTRIKAFEIVRLFRFYYIDNILKYMYPKWNNWTKFVDEWSNRELHVINLLHLNKDSTVSIDNLDVQTHPNIQHFIGPVEAELKKKINLDLKLLDLRRITIDRHEYTHQPVRTVAEQRHFFSSCGSYSFPDNYKFTTVLQEMSHYVHQDGRSPSTIFKEQFHNTLIDMDYRMNDKEFDQLWDKFHIDDFHATSSEKFLKRLKNEEVVNKSPSIPTSEAQDQQTPILKASHIKSSPNHSQMKTLRLHTARGQLDQNQIRTWLNQKFPQGFSELENALERLSIKLEINRSEIVLLWSICHLKENGNLDFYQFLREFGYTKHSAHYPNAKQNPPKKGDADFLLTSRKLYGDSVLVHGATLNAIRSNWDQLRREFTQLDPYRTGFIQSEEFDEILIELCPAINQDDLDIFKFKFETKHDSRMNYVKFLKHHAPIPQLCDEIDQPTRKSFSSNNDYSSQISSSRTHINELENKLRRKLSDSYKQLRRSFKQEDITNSGSVPVKTFRDILNQHKCILNDEQFYTLTSQIDTQMDGTINYNYFIQHYLKNT